jgi:hypothetical protein
MYLMGMPFLRRRKSALIDGAAADARELSDHLASYLAARQARPQGTAAYSFVRIATSESGCPAQ